MGYWLEAAVMAQMHNWNCTVPMTLALAGFSTFPRSPQENAVFGTIAAAAAVSS